MGARIWRQVLAAGVGAMTVGMVGLHARLLWETWRGMRPPLTQGIPLTIDQPQITVVVPARNEARNIRRCIASLLGQTYPNYDVICVDDGSTDATPSILAELQRGPGGTRLRVIHAEELPQGWAGKPHALAAGTAQAQGEWLLFTDADTVHRPGALAWAVRQAQTRAADLFSIVTHQEYADISSHLLLPIAVMGITTQYPPTKIANPNSATAIANGQYLMIRRAMYDGVGGYADPALRASVVDDRDLAAAVKRRGGRVVLMDGRDQVSVLMYRTLREAWRGWGKNAYAGSRGGPMLFALMALGLPFVSIAPFALALAGIVTRRRGLALAGSAQVASIMVYRWLLDRQMRHSRLWGWGHPAGGALMTALLANAAWRQFTGRGVEWSGRTYQTDQKLLADRAQAPART